MSPEDELIAQYLAGDRGAGEGFVRLVAPRLGAFLHRLVGSAKEAEDLGQEVFARFFGSLARYQGQGRVMGYLLTIAANLARDRRRRPAEDALDDQLAGTDAAAAPAARAEARDTLHRVRRALDRLPEEERKALILKEFEHMPYAAIAQVMGVSIGAIKQKIFRARRALRAELGDSRPEMPAEVDRVMS